VPAGFLFKGQKLGDWVRLQRTLFKDDQLEESRAERLDALGMVWKVKGKGVDPRDDLWNTMFQELIQYKEEHGDCR
jgi:Helicase associated domain